MHYRHKKTAQTVSIPVAITAGCFAAWIVTLFMAILVTFLIANERISENALKSMPAITATISAFISATVAAKMTDQKRMVTCLINGGVYYLSLICCTALFFDGSYQGMIGVALCVIGSSAAAGLLGMKPKKNKIRYAKK